MAPDYTNKTIAKLMSLDFLTLIAIVGIAWGAMTVKVESLEESHDEDKEVTKEALLEIKMDNKELTTEVIENTRKLDVIGNNQQHFREQIDHINNSLDTIRKILEEK